MEVGIIIGAAIGAGTTVLGVWLNSRRDDRIRAEEYKRAQHSELLHAMRAYLAAIDAITGEMPNELVIPPPSKFDRQLVKVGNALGLDFPAAIIGRLLQRAMYGNRHHQLLDRMVDASAHLRLVATPAVEALMIDGTGIGRKYVPGDEQWLETWTDFRQRIRTGFREILDDPEAKPSPLPTLGVSENATVLERARPSD